MEKCREEYSHPRQMTDTGCAGRVAWLVAGVAAVGLLKGSTGRMARFAAAGCSIVLLVAAVRVGHAGAELVYRHGAAQAHLVDGAAQPRPDAGEVNHHDDDDDDDD